MKSDVVHIPDESRGRTADDDVKFALCGFRVRLGDMKNWYGLLPEQINCAQCKEVNSAAIPAPTDSS